MEGGREGREEERKREKERGLKNGMVFKEKGLKRSQQEIDLERKFRRRKGRL